jgi:hypothetical protein
MGAIELTAGLVSKGGHPAVKATIAKANDIFSQLFLTQPDTSAAEDALVRVENEQRGAGVLR